MELNKNQLKNALALNFDRAKIKCFVVSVDELDEIDKNISCFIAIVNHQPNYINSGHWSLIFRVSHNIVFYHDPLCLSIPEDIIHFMLSCCKNVLATNLVTQSLMSNICGYVCQYMCSKLIKNTDLKSVLISEFYGLTIQEIKI